MLWEPLRADSEDEKGNKIYLKERCPHYRQLMMDVEKQRALSDQRRERIVKENLRLKELGRPEIQVPGPIKTDMRDI